MNSNVMYHKIYYRPGKLINPNKYGDSQVKIIVEESSTPQKLSQLVDNLYKAGVQDVKVIENIDISVDDDVEVEAEDTLTTLTKYVNAMENDVNKENLVNIFRSLYVEAQEV